MSMEHRWNEMAGETGEPGENPPQRRFVHHKSHMRSPGIEPGPKRKSALWGLFLLMAIGGTIYLCCTSWKNYWENPTVIVMESNFREWNTTFPAVFLCPGPIRYDEAQVNATAQRLALEANTDNIPRLEHFLKTLANLNYDNLHTLKEFKGDPIIPTSSFWELYYEIKFPFKSDSSEAKNAYELPEIMTELGMCYAHNSIVASSSITSADLLRGSYLNVGIAVMYNHLNTGAYIYFKDPWDIPTYGDIPDYNEYMYYIIYRLKALSLYATEDVKKLNVHHRKCRFNDEAEDIEISNVYTRSICYSQCRVKLAMKLCGCIPFFYPKMINEGKYQECDIDGFLCLEKHQEALTSNDILAEDTHSCNCYLTCEEITYTYDILSNDTWEEQFGGTQIEWGVVEYPTLRLKVDILVSFTDVLVSFGGSAGLFLGCSVLSLVEIIYYLTLRFFFYLQQKRC